MTDEEAIIANVENSDSGETDLERVVGDANGVAALGECWRMAANYMHMAEMNLMMRFIHGDESYEFSGEFNSEQAKAFKQGLKALSTMMLACYQEMLGDDANSPEEPIE